MKLKEGLTVRLKTMLALSLVLLTWIPAFSVQRTVMIEEFTNTG